MDGVALPGRYRLDGLLGRGGMAEVHRGWDAVLDRPVAIKLFRSATADPRRADAEIRTLAALSHPNVVAVYDAGGTAAGDTFLVMQLVDGPTLGQRLVTGPLPGTEVAALGADLADALDYIHRRGVVHRDVKPANVLLEPQPAGGYHPKLTDFGIARLVDGAGMTQQGWALGTPTYLSPEQAAGEPAGPASDIYSLGLVLLEALTGRPAYPGTGLEVAAARLYRPPAIPAELGRSWVDLLAAMTARDPAARPRAGAVAHALRTRSGLAAAGPTVALPPRRPGAVPAAGRPAGWPGERPGGTALLPPPAPSVRRPRRRAVAWVIGALIALAVVVAVLAATTTGASRPPGAAGASASSPSYPAVAGRLGADLAALQQLVPALLRPDVLAVTEAAAAGNRDAAGSALDTLTADLAAAQSAGQVDATRADSIRAAVTRIRADLAPAATPTPTASPTPTPSPPGGDGKAPGKDDKSPGKPGKK